MIVYLAGEHRVPLVKCIDSHPMRGGERPVGQALTPLLLRTGSLWGVHG
jgi:hypothetical protein